MRLSNQTGESSLSASPAACPVPDERMWIDVGNLIRQHLPDKNGNTLPEG
jgi:hypothetical protein